MTGSAMPRRGIPAEALTADAVHVEQLISDGRDAYWVEARPDEEGRRVVMRAAAGVPVEVLPRPYSASSAVYEYGGGALAVDNGDVFFVNQHDQGVYALVAGTPAPELLYVAPHLRFGGLSVDRPNRRLLAVAEDRSASAQVPDHRVVSVPLEGGGPRTLLEGEQFYMHPRADVAGRRLAWVTWSVPNMAWDGCQLHVAALEEDGVAGASTVVAGGADESAAYPTWAPDGSLYFLSDRLGWWSVWHWDGSGSARRIGAADGEMCSGTPAPSRWPIALSKGGVVAPLVRGGTGELVRVTANGTTESLPTGCTWVAEPVIAGDRCFFVGGSFKNPLAVRCLDLSTQRVSSRRTSVHSRLPLESIDPPRPVMIPTPDGAVTHGLFHRPLSDASRPVATTAPPLIVNVHGGPVMVSPNAVILGMYAVTSPLFWTSRGFAVLDLDYRGSFGYGRAFRTAIRGRWGEVDVLDAVAAVDELADRGLVDGSNALIRGASAGGSTALMALTTTDRFKGGAAYFPVVDQSGDRFGEHTHKFEAHYNLRLIGPWPEARETYRDRSAITHVTQLSAPVLVLQGSDDRVCPESETRRFVEAARAARCEVEYLVFPGEGHGFVRAENIITSLHAELALYDRLVGSLELGQRVTVAC